MTNSWRSNGPDIPPEFAPMREGYFNFQKYGCKRYLNTKDLHFLTHGINNMVNVFHRSSRFSYFYFNSLLKSPKCTPFSMKYSKLLRFLGKLPQTPSSEGASCLRQSQLRAFGACSSPNS